MQTKWQSFVEANANTFIGYWISIAVQLVVYPIYGASFTFGQNMQIGFIFLIVSLIRSYAFRRYFNWRHHVSR